MPAHNTTDADADAQDATTLDGYQADLRAQVDALEQHAATVSALERDLNSLRERDCVRHAEIDVSTITVSSDGSETTEELELSAAVDMPDEFVLATLPSRYNWQRYNLDHQERPSGYYLRGTIWLESIVPPEER